MSPEQAHTLNVLKAKLNPNQKPIKTALDGKPLNLSERFKIANKVFNAEKTLRTMNIPDLKKYQILALVLGCDKDNARDLKENRK